MKTFGTVTRDDDQWVISAQADVAIRLKRIFPAYKPHDSETSAYSTPSKSAATSNGSSTAGP